MSDELDDRLRRLGTHLDAERSESMTRVAVVALDRHHPRGSSMILGMVAALVVLGGLIALSTTRSGSPDRYTAATAPPSTAATGTLTMDFEVVNSPDDEARKQAVARLEERAVALGLDASASISLDNTVNLVVRNIVVADLVVVERSFKNLGDTIQLRPVMSACGLADGVALAPSSDPAITQRLLLLGTNTACEVGPAQGTGSVFDRATSTQALDDRTMSVVVGLRPGASGEDTWNALAAQCFRRDPTCPTQQLAIELGGLLYTAASVQTPAFSGAVQINGGFSALEARALADTLSHGPNPFALSVLSASFDRAMP